MLAGVFAASPGAAAIPEVVITAPLAGGEQPLNEVPANVQRIDADRMAHRIARDPADALNQVAASVTANDTQGNPFQPDVSFRGFTSSPVLGTPQGVSVFVDGVRVNEAFGDSIAWDLIPQSAIASISVIPGSDPVFGLNTLGGAIAITTRRGSDSPGTLLESYGGSYGRRSAQLTSGGRDGRLDWFVSGNLFDDDGWGAHNPSRVRQLFAKAGYRDALTDISLALTRAENSLSGNQTLPLSFLSSPAESYTWPDTQTDRMSFAVLDARRHLTDAWLVAANGYYRQVDLDVGNSNVNGDFDPALPQAPGNEPTGNVLEAIGQRRPGIALQLSGSSRIGGLRNRLIVGASYDRGSTDYRQYSQEAGASRDTQSSAVPLLGTSLHAVNASTGLYFSDTLGLSRGLHLSVAGRFNDATITLDDRLGHALDGRHRYRRFDPSLGITLNPSPSLTLYASYDEGMRVPTPVELTCADPAAPCALPNAFAADPPLRAVVARTFEVGARGSAGPAIALSGALFHTQLNDDIQFVSAGAAAIGTGYFENVGQTLRQGAELLLDARRASLRVSARYTLLDASFRNPLVLGSPNNSSAAALSCAGCAEILVRRGDRIPGLPRHILKLRVGWERPAWGVGVGFLGQSGQYARGDENNSDVNGPLPGFVVVNLDAHWDPSARWSLFLRAENLLDRRYSSFGLLGRNVFTGPGASFDATGASWRSEQFRTAGAPRGIWAGFSIRLAEMAGTRE